jgi:tetratricopeptide (TPR) repeat protein
MHTRDAPVGCAGRRSAFPLRARRHRGVYKLAFLFATASIWVGAQRPGANLEDEARRLSAAGDYEGAAKAYEALTTQKPGSASAYINLGVAYAKLGRFPLAEKAYRAALAIEPKSLPALINLGLAEFKAGKYAEALKPLETALDVDTSNRQAQALLAMSHFSLRQFDAAAPFFEMLYRNDPGNTTLQYMLSESYFRAHQQGHLEALVQEISKSFPDSPALHMLAGEAYDQLNRTDAAIEEFRQAEHSDPRLPRIHFYLGYLYWERREYELAAAEFEAELARPEGEHAQAEGYLGDIAMRNGATKRAEELFKRAILADRGVRIAHLGLGIIFEQQQKWAEAEKEFQAAIALDPNSVDAYYRIAQVYRALNKPAQQKAMLSKMKDISEGRRISADRVLSGAPPNTR